MAEKLEVGFLVGVGVGVVGAEAVAGEVGPGGGVEGGGEGIGSGVSTGGVGGTELRYFKTFTNPSGSIIPVSLFCPASCQ